MYELLQNGQQPLFFTFFLFFSFFLSINQHKKKKKTRNSTNKKINMSETKTEPTTDTTEYKGKVNLVSSEGDKFEVETKVVSSWCPFLEPFFFKKKINK
jgi:hypothetical protein